MTCYDKNVKNLQPSPQLPPAPFSFDDDDNEYDVDDSGGVVVVITVMTTTTTMMMISVAAFVVVFSTDVRYTCLRARVMCIPSTRVLVFFQGNTSSCSSLAVGSLPSLSLEY